jgi:hypothetical protein
MPFNVQSSINQSNGGELALKAAVTLRGRPYVFGGWPANGGGTDCSGLSEWSYEDIGVTLARTTYVQYSEYPEKKGTVEQPGDLLFIAGSDAEGSLPGHVMIFVKPGQVFQAPHTGESINFYDYDTSVYEFLTRPSLALPKRIPNPSSEVLKANQLIVATTAIVKVAKANNWAIRNWDGTSFPLSDANSPATAILYCSQNYKKKNK